MSDKFEKGLIVFVPDADKIADKEVLNQYLEALHDDSQSDKADVIKQRLFAEVIKLRDLEKKAILSYFYDNLSVDEIAQKLNLKAQSVRRHLSTALKNLKNQITSTEFKKETVGI